MEWRPTVNTDQLSMVKMPKKTFMAVVLLSIFVSGIYTCPMGCSCQTNSPVTTPSTVVGSFNNTPSYGISIPKMVTRKKSKRGRRGPTVDCSNTHRPLLKLDEINRNNLPLHTVQLILKGNKLSRIPKGAFSSLSMLRKLDLSNNEIRLIEPGAFEGLANLEKLELSGNLIDHINISMFVGLPKLQKLYMSGNRLRTIPEGTFKYLPSLKRINFQSMDLRCDCHLRWIVAWSQDQNVLITRSTTCAGPQDLAKRRLRSLRAKDLHCQHPLELDIFEVLPNHSQVVFVGDKLPFHCRVSIIDPATRVFWLRGNQPVTSNSSAGIFVHTTYNLDRTVITHDLVLEKLDMTHNGVWECHVTTSLGNDTRRVNIVVISDKATSCAATTVHTNKGVYKWDKTVAGIRIEVPCKRNHLGKQMASFTCNSQGEWESLHIERCDYMSEVTRRLHKFSRMSGKGLTKLSRDLLAFLHQIKRPLTSTDVVFVMRTVVEKIIPRVTSQTPKAAQNALDIVSFLMDVNRAVLLKAQMEERACSQLVRAMENLSQNVITSAVSTVRYSTNIMLTSRTEPSKAFPGVACIVTTRVRAGVEKFHEGNCYPGINQSLFTRVSVQPSIKAAVMLPKTLLTTVPIIQGIDFNTIGVGVTVYNDTSLFPFTAIEHADPRLADRIWQPASPVISANVGQPVVNLSEPVVIMLRVTNKTGLTLVPVFWDFSANDGRGDWSSDGCHLTDATGPLVIVECHHLTNFAILSTTVVASPPGTFHILQPVVYAGSCLLLMFTMAVAVTYITCFRFIQMPKKMKHAIINICLSLFFMCISYTLGVTRVDHLRLCQVIGVNIHYFSLSTIFWVTIASSNMMKKLMKAERPSVQSLEMSMMPIPPKPMVRFYLLGWGVPLIICGITAAVDLNHYARLHYCFLSWEVSLGAFYCPVALLVILNFVFFLRISCLIHSAVVLGGRDASHTDETVELHTNEIELINHDFVHPADTQSIAQSDTSTASSIFDTERRPINQLRALVAMLFFYIVIWMCGAFAVAQPFRNIMPQQDVIFSYLYAIVCVLYGAFILAYYCISRKDSRLGLKQVFLRQQVTSHFGVNSGGRVANPISRMHRGGGHQSASSVDSSSCNGKAVNLRNSQQLKSQNQSKQCNLNLISSHNTSSVTSGSVASGHNSAVNFYNTRQNGVAKKYWEKRHYLSSASKGINNCSTSCTSNYGSNSVKHISGCTSSDTNTHFSIEIQIQASPGHLAPPNSSVSTPGVQKLYGRCAGGSIADSSMYSPLNLPHESSQAPLAAARSILANGTVPLTVASSCDIHRCVSDTTQAPECSLDDSIHPSVCTCGSGRADLDTTNQDTSQSEQRPLDFDGQSQVSQETPARCRDTCKNVPTINELSSNQLPHKCVKSFHSLSSSLNASPAHHDGSHWSSVSSRHPMDYNSDTNVSRKEAFLNELQQRIPRSCHRPLSPARSDIGQSTSSRLFTPNIHTPSRVAFSADSDHNSEPAIRCHRRRKNHHSHHHHHHHNHHHGRHKLVSKHAKSSWDSQLMKKRTKPAYTFVSQDCIDKVSQNNRVTVNKSLTQTTDNTCPSDNGNKSVHFSPSHDDEIQPGGMEAMAEDTSSSDDSADDMWLPLSKKSKKETSV